MTLQKTNRSEFIANVIVALIILSFTMWLIYFSIRYADNEIADVTDTTRCQELLADPDVLQYVNTQDYWSEGKITSWELDQMESFCKKIELKRKYNE